MHTKILIIFNNWKLSRIRVEFESISFIMSVLTSNDSHSLCLKYYYTKPHTWAAWTWTGCEFFVFTLAVRDIGPNLETTVCSKGINSSSSPNIHSLNRAEAHFVDVGHTPKEKQKMCHKISTTKSTTKQHLTLSEVYLLVILRPCNI